MCHPFDTNCLLFNYLLMLKQCDLIFKKVNYVRINNGEWKKVMNHIRGRQLLIQTITAL
jgi:hypothetical protein